MRTLHSREINAASSIRGCVPDEGGLFLVVWVRVCNRTALSVSVRVRGLRPGSDPFVRLGIACLEEKSFEWGTSDGNCKIDEPSFNKGGAQGEREGARHSFG